MILIAMVGFFCFTGSAFQGSDAGKTGKIPLRAKAGAYYFDGWTTGSGHITNRLKTEFSDREPVWGWNDDSLPIVEQQIDYAADAGLAFFAFDWYYPEGSDKESPLNTGLNLYLKARNKSRLEFCLLVANHGGFRIGPKDWDAVCDIWTGLFREPTHLKVNGKPLIIFFSARELLNSFETTDTLKSAFNRLREKARSAGLDGVEIATCATPGPKWDWDNLSVLASAGFDSFTGYNYHGHPKKGPYDIQEYAWMIEGHEDIWNLFAKHSPIPYIPVVTTGWDMRPWEALDAKKRSVYYPDRTPRQLADFVRRAIRWMDVHPEKTSRERILLLYAWNENGEGGYLTPLKSTGAAYLNTVHDALSGK